MRDRTWKEIAKKKEKKRSKKRNKEKALKGKEMKKIMIKTFLPPGLLAITLFFGTPPVATPPLTAAFFC